MSTSAIAPSQKPAGTRRRQADSTKRSILRMAQQAFAERSYADVGIRDIAASAGVNSALIARYFGSKFDLFEAALDASLDVRLFIQSDRDKFGETMAEAFIDLPRDAAPAIPMLAFAAGDAATQELALRLLQRRVLEPLEQWFDQVEAADRAAQLMAVVTGFFIYRVMLPVPAIATNPSQPMREWLAGVLQEIVDRPRRGS